MSAGGPVPRPSGPRMTAHGLALLLALAVVIVYWPVGGHEHYR